MLLVYSFLVAATLVAVSNAHCGDLKIDGVNPSSVSSVYQGLFTYPDPADDSLYDNSGSAKRRFDCDGVIDFEPLIDTTTLYQAQDDEGDKFGNTLDIEAVYNTQAETFKELCEEIWACAYVHLRECCYYMDYILYSDF
jgi:hypothetical protein